MGISKPVGYCSPYIPVEWISAHQLVPLKLTPGASPVDAPVAHLPGLCPFARAYGNTVSLTNDLSAALFSARCDQMRRMSEIVTMVSDLPVHLFSFPHTRNQIIAEQHFENELGRLSEFLVSLGAEELDLALLKQAMVASNASSLASIANEGGKRIALLGGPVLAEHECIDDFVEACGGTVVLDGTERGSRCKPQFDERLIEIDPVLALVSGYLTFVPDPFARPNDDLYTWLRDNITEDTVDGVIIHRYLWCDGWHAEVERIKEALCVPVLDIDSEEGRFDTERTATRVRAFMEMLP